LRESRQVKLDACALQDPARVTTTVVALFGGMATDEVVGEEAGRLLMAGVTDVGMTLLEPDEAWPSEDRG
jgi:hypothetical protein